MNHKINKILMVGLLSLASFTASAAELQIQNVHFEQEVSQKPSASKNARLGSTVTDATGAELIHIQTDGPATVKVFTLDNPPRVVIDLPTFRWKVPSSQLQAYKGKLLRQVRYARHSETVSRIVLDLNQTITPQVISSGNSSQHTIRLVPAGAPTSAPAKSTTFPKADAQADEPRLRNSTPIQTKEGTLGRTTNKDDDDDHAASPQQASSPYPTPRLKPGKESQETPAYTESPAPISSASSSAKKIVVIDAGHGGQDPGAIGPSGMQEKFITLAFAKALKERLESTGRYKAVLTRDKDFFIPLRQRVNIARQAKGDLFVSLHADSAPGSEARGLSLYSLSETASDAEAAKLAAKENKADIINGVDLSGASKDVADILIDLTQRSTMARSESFGTSLLTGIRQASVTTLQKPHRHAGFAVLKAPDIPSVLVELGFVSHPQEEQLLQKPAHRAQIVDGLAKGIDSYFAKTTTNR